jgi:hypothetical protein
MVSGANAPGIWHARAREFDHCTRSEGDCLKILVQCCEPRAGACQVSPGLFSGLRSSAPRAPRGRLPAWTTPRRERGEDLDTLAVGKRFTVTILSPKVNNSSLEA